ncbi:MAG: hypothetical protein JSS97_03825 [Actinobacteria bacterium]|nr:hypothetical protein [Actinomycetota bacterium]
MIRRITTTITLIAALGCLLGAPVAARADFGIKPGSFKTTFEVSEGVVALPQASSHPYAYNLSFELNTDSQGITEGGELRDILINLPPGMIGNPAALQKCTRQEFEGFLPACTPNSQIGIIHANIPGIGLVQGPMYNMVPPPGVAAQLGFSADGLNALQNASLLSRAEGYGIRVTTNSVPLEATSVKATIWGTPADASHDALRGPQAAGGTGGSTPFQGAHEAFLTLPASCGAALETTVSVDSKLLPGIFTPPAVAYSLNAGGEAAALTGCDAVPFEPSVSATPTAPQAQTSSGLDFSLKLPNEGLTNPEPGAIAETEPVKTEVTLPAGITINPSAAAGQTACPLSQFEPGAGLTPSCPSSSKIGTLVAHSPLLEEPIEGGVYLAEQGHNPFGSLVAIYFIASAPVRGVTVAQAGRVQIDPGTGQLTTTFDELPPIPYSDFTLNLREGPRGALTTPQACGTYTTVARLYPFSAPGSAVERTAPFKVTSGPEGGGCVGSEAQLPNSPSFEAGTQAPLAGMYSPFVLKLSRNEASQHFRALNVTLPPGLTARLVGTSECSDSQIAQAASRSREGEGALEQSNPSCPADSEIGTVTVGAGSGAPLYVQGHAYLAGPYKGAPLSMAIITPAVAGPFDLGVVVVRAALYVNESTAQVSVKSDPLPTSLHGIPLDVRSIAVHIAKSNFTLNPTSCEVKALGAEAVSTTGQVASLQNRFQVGGCRGLKFEPKLKLQLKGATKRAGHPALKAVVTYPKEGEYANIASAQVGLPHALFLDQGNLNKVCKQAELKAATCPKSSVYGHAKAWTPLLAKPLEGPVYLGVGYGYKLPALVADLNGQVRFLLVGKVDTTKQHGLRNTFEVVPDAPISRFVLEMKGGGKYGLLENSENLCAKTQRANARLVAQNGLIDQFHPQIGVQCKKAKK